MHLAILSSYVYFLSLSLSLSLSLNSFVLLFLVWLDTRTASTAERLIHNTPTNDKTYFQVHVISCV